MARKLFYLDKDGTWWFRQAAGTRQRAKVRDCKTCGETFVRAPSSRDLYCSAECRRRPCRRCGKEFRPSTNRQVYCSLPCRRGVGKCEQCGKKYVFSHHGAKRFCSLACFYANECPVGTVRYDTSGYTITKVPHGTPGIKTRRGTSDNNWMWTHRWVMQQHIGRPLRKNEHVHHINGVRDDNRLENLELWKGSHPHGVRAKDYHCPGCRCFEHP